MFLHFRRLLSCEQIKLKKNEKKKIFPNAARSILRRGRIDCL